MRCHSSELYKEGLAVAVYNIDAETQVFRFKDEERTVPFLSVPQFDYKGWTCVAKWSDVIGRAR